MTKLFLNSEWTSRLSEFTKLYVGFSGGLDSTVLLHLLASEPLLAPNLIAVHINHGISPNALAWQHHCAHYCSELGIDCISQKVEFERSANIEEEARNARHAVFSSMVQENECLILGHHQNDQAETVLLQLFRGAGIDGLAAMTEWSSYSLGALARPLLSYARQQLETYAQQHKLQWIEDESNQDIKYSRNYVRHQIMPLLIKKWPGVVGNISRTASHCQQAKTNLDALALYDNPGLAETSYSLFLEPLKSLSIERLTNVVRFWLKKNQIKLPSAITMQRIIQEVLFARADATPEVSWSEVQVRRYKQHLYIIKKNPVNPPVATEWTKFPEPLVWIDHNIQLTAKKTTQGLVIPAKAKLVIKFRQGGEEFCWHGQNKQLKKLFQEWKIPPWLRDTIPLLYINDQLAAVIGYAVSDLFFSHDSTQAWQLSTIG